LQLLRAEALIRLGRSQAADAEHQQARFLQPARLS